MKRIRRKLNSRKGASITYALLIFLVCAVVGSAVLVAGTAASGRMSEVAEYDQRYYAVTSAARLMIDMIDDNPVTIIKKETANGVSPNSVAFYRNVGDANNDTNPLSGTMQFESIPLQAAYQLISGTTTPINNTLRLTTNMAGITTLNVDISEMINSAGQMTIIITKSTGTYPKARAYRLNLVFNPVIDQSVPISETDPAGITTTITTYNYTWQLRDIKVM